MKFRLPLSKMQHDFYGSIIETIQKYYPIGIKSQSPDYQSYPGQIELGEIIIDNIHSNKNYKSRWKEFEKKLKSELKKQIVGETYAMRPSFSASLIINKTKRNDLIHFKRLHFSVSLLGPFYTIYGVDETTIVDEKDGRDRFYTSINVVTVSPYKEYEHFFNILKVQIEEKFKGYKFIPFRLHSMTIEGLYDPSHDDRESTIYEALFDDLLEGYNTFKMRGDSDYGSKEWIKY